MIIINISTDFSDCPGPRYCVQGDYSGEEFYHALLNKNFANCYQNQTKLLLNLDNTNGYMSSFLDEAIGNLVYDFGEKEVKDKLQLVSNEEPSWIRLIYDRVIPEWAENRNNKKDPKKTQKHDAWYRLIDDKLIERKWVEAV